MLSGGPAAWPRRHPQGGFSVSEETEISGYITRDGRIRIDNVVWDDDENCVFLGLYEWAELRRQLDEVATAYLADVQEALGS
jgi:hypothetical protein